MRALSFLRVSSNARSCSARSRLSCSRCAASRALRLSISSACVRIRIRAGDTRGRICSLRCVTRVWADVGAVADGILGP